MTMAGLGNTAVTIWASWPTVMRISSYRLARPGSSFGAAASGSGSDSQLEGNIASVGQEKTATMTANAHGPADQPSSGLLHSLLRDEEVVLVDVDLNARLPAVEVLQRLGAVL